MKKRRTLEQVETAQRRAVSAAETLLGDDDLADELEDLSPEEYAERKGFEIINPSKPPKHKGEKIMATVKQLQAQLRRKEAQIAELETQNEGLEDELQELEGTLAEIRGLVAADDESDDDSDEESDDDSDEEVEV
jgi:hypothetical protein